jgi:hypothetical protein
MSGYRHGASQVVRRQQGEDEVGDGVQVEQGGGARVVHVPHRILTLKLYWYNSIVLNICNIRIPTKRPSPLTNGMKLNEEKILNSD